MSTTSIDDISAIIGEMRNFTVQQAITNTHMLDELKKISDRMSGFAENSATFVEYRKTLHERFGHVHEQIMHMDEQQENMLSRLCAIEVTVATWKSNWKLLVAVFTVLSTGLSALITHYGNILMHL